MLCNIFYGTLHYKETFIEGTDTGNVFCSVINYVSREATTLLFSNQKRFYGMQMNQYYVNYNTQQTELRLD